MELNMGSVLRLLHITIAFIYSFNWEFIERLKGISLYTSCLIVNFIEEIRIFEMGEQKESKIHFLGFNGSMIFLPKVYLKVLYIVFIPKLADQKLNRVLPRSQFTLIPLLKLWVHLVRQWPLTECTIALTWPRRIPFHPLKLQWPLTNPKRAL